MTESTLDMLTKQVDYAAETIAEYARQIESGEYGNRWIVTDEDGNEVGTVIASDEDAETLREKSEEIGNTIERDSFDEPTIVDENGNESPISEWPLSVEVKIGRPLAVVIGTGGPHIEIVQELGAGGAKLAGYWGGEKVYRHGDEFQTVLDYFTDSLWDEAPEEYK